MTDPEARQVCPYVGLQPFQESDQDFFKGRERDQRIIVANLLSASLTVLYGSAGAGKSSLLLAGVVPQLRRDRPRTPVVVFRDWVGDGFQRALSRACIEETWTRHMPQQPKPSETLPLDEILRACALAARGTVLVLLDQFEEYLLYHPKSADPESFEAQLARAVNRDDADVGFLISVRETSLSQLDRFRERIPNLLGNTLRLQHLDEKGARAAIGQPVLEVWNEKYSAGQPVTIEDELVDEVVRQVQVGLSLGSHGGRGVAHGEERVIEAPFLQLVMTRLWAEESKHVLRTLRAATLQRLGGAKAIVRAHLEDVMVRLDAEGKAVCASFFDRLVTPTGSTVSCNAEDLVRWAGSHARQVPATLQLLSESRILRTVEAEPGKTEETRYEIFHDVLAPAILDWQKRYVEDQGRVRAVEEERARARVRIWRLWVPALAASTLLALVGWIHADRDYHLAWANQKAAESVATARFDSQRVLKLALESAAPKPWWSFWRSDAVPATENALRLGVQASRLEWTRSFEGAVRSLAYSPDGTKLAIGSPGPKSTSRLQIWDLTSDPPVPEDVQRLASANATGLAFLPDRQHLVAASGSSVWMWGFGQREAPREALRQNLPIHTAFALSADGKWLATAGASPRGPDDGPAFQDRAIHLWDLAAASPQPIRTIKVAGAWVMGLAFSPDGCCLASTFVEHGTEKGATFAAVWSVKTGARILSLPVAIESDTVAFDPNGTFLVIGGRDGRAHLLRPAKGELAGLLAERAVVGSKPAADVLWFDQVLAGHLERLRDVAVSRDGSRIATASADHKVKVWDSATGENLLTLKGHTSYVETVAFSPDGQHLVSGSLDYTVRMWNIAGHTGGVYGVAFSPDRQSPRIATASGDRTAKLWDLSTATPRLLHTLAGHADTVYRLAFDPQGERIATASFDRSALLWDVKTGRRLHTFCGHTDQLRDVTFSPDGQNLATGSADGTARLYSLADLGRRPDIDCTAVQVRHSPRSVIQVSAVVFGPQEKQWVTGGWDGALRLWDFAGHLLGEIPPSPEYTKPPRVVDLAFVCNGTELAALVGHTVYFWPVSGFGQKAVEPTRKVSVEGPKTFCESMTFSRDGKQLAVACSDGAAHLYDADTLALVKTIGVHTDWVMGAAFSPDGSKLATASLDKTFQVSPLVFRDLYKLAKQVQAARSGETPSKTPLQ